jgi:hypothetical protein
VVLAHLEITETMSAVMETRRSDCFHPEFSLLAIFETTSGQERY